MAEVAMTANSTAAADKALGVTELLENVLSHLSMRHLIRAQAVCKQWRAVIHGSKVLRQNLFLEPRPPRPAPKPIPNVARRNRRGRLIQRPTNPNPSVEREMHPLLRSVDLMNQPYNQATAYYFNNRDKATIDSWLPSWPPGQWEDMLVTQPPPQKVGIWAWAGTASWGRFRDPQYDLSIENSGGVRLGQLAKFLKNFDVVEEEDGVWEGMDFNVAEVEKTYVEEEIAVFFKIEAWFGEFTPNIVGSST